LVSYQSLHDINHQIPHNISCSYALYSIVESGEIESHGVFSQLDVLRHLLGKMNGKACGRSQPWPALKYYSNILMEELRKTKRISSRDIRPLRRESNSGPPEYETVMLLQYLFSWLNSCDFRSRNAPQRSVIQSGARNKVYNVSDKEDVTN